MQKEGLLYIISKKDEIVRYRGSGVDSYFKKSFSLALDELEIIKLHEHSSNFTTHENNGHKDYQRVVRKGSSYTHETLLTPQTASEEMIKVLEAYLASGKSRAKLVYQHYIKEVNEVVDRSMPPKMEMQYVYDILNNKEHLGSEIIGKHANPELLDRYNNVLEGFKKLKQQHEITPISVLNQFISNVKQVIYTGQIVPGR